MVKAGNWALRDSVLDTLGELGWQRVKLTKGLGIDDAIVLYQAIYGVEYVQPNFYYHLLATPNDPQYISSVIYCLGKISPHSAWDLSTGSASGEVAEIYTGLLKTHVRTPPNAWTNPCEKQGNG